MLKLGYALLLALCGAVLVHIAIVILITRLDQPQTTQKIDLLTQTNDPLILRGDAGNAQLSGLDPFFRYRICEFDLQDGAFQLASTGDAPFFSAALVSDNGDVLFSITDRQTIDRTLNMEVRSAAEQQRLSQGFAENAEASEVVPVFIEAKQGYAIVRVFVPDPSWNEIADTFLNEIVCQSIEVTN